MLFVLVLSFAVPFACHAGLIGAPSDVTIDASDPNVVFAVNAINEYYAKQGDNAVRTLDKVVKVQKQTVAGYLYRLTLRLSSGSQKEECKVNVWTRLWMPADQQIQLSGVPVCKPLFSQPPIMPGGEYPVDINPESHIMPGGEYPVDINSGPHIMPGGEYPIDINLDEVQRALSAGVTASNMRENYNRKAIRVNSVTAQTVSGITYHFHGVDLAATDCTKGSNTVLTNCNVAFGADTLTCDFDVLWQYWVTPEYRLTHISCQ